VSQLRVVEPRRRTTIHLRVNTQSEIALAWIKADPDAKMAVPDANLKATTLAQKAPRLYPSGSEGEGRSSIRA
jgi:hypothetical protein